MKKLLKTKPGTILILTFCVSFFLFSACSNKKADTISFAVVSDTHYKSGESTLTESFVKPFAEEINTTYPEIGFVAHLGDFAQDIKPPVQGYYETNLKFGLKNFTNQVNRPLLIARGNHDVKTVYEEIALPFISNELEKVTQVEKILETLYYSFDYGNSHFIFLDDFYEADNEAELKWLVNDLKETKNKESIKHTFVMSHNPIWRYDRPWDIKPFTKNLIPILAEYEIDALFCGHIHQNNASVRIFNNKKIMQLMTSAQGNPKYLEEANISFNAASKKYETFGFIPVEKVQKILLPEEDLSYNWAYTSGAPSSYYIVSVNGSNVNVKLCSPGNGVIRELFWEKPNEIVDIKGAPPSEEILSIDDFGQISEAKLYYSCWSNSWTKAPVFLNGEKIGNLKVNSPDARWWREDFRNTIEIDPAFFPLIKSENKIIIKNPDKDELGIAHCMLHITTKKGKQFFSSVSQYAYLSAKNISSDTSPLRNNPLASKLRISTKEDIENIGLPDRKVLKKVNLGEDLYPIKLRFYITTPPCPPSTLIESISWDWGKYANFAKGSDLWPVTWASDDNIYTAWGDGGGFGGDNQQGRVMLGFGRIEGSPEHLIETCGKPGKNMFNTWGGACSEGSAKFDGYPMGLLSVDEVLYCFRNMDNSKYEEYKPDIELCWSGDLGKTWSRADWIFNGGEFGEISFLNFGRDYSGARDNYVYMYGSEMHIRDKIFLARVPKENIKNKSAYEFLSAFDGNNNPVWNSDITKRKPIIYDPNGCSSVPRVSYNPGIKRYILTIGHRQIEELGIFEAKEPWGPWYTVAYYNNWGNCNSSEEGRALAWDFPTKWISPDGLTMWCVFSGNQKRDELPDGAREFDRCNIVKATLKLH